MKDNSNSTNIDEIEQRQQVIQSTKRNWFAKIFLPHFSSILQSHLQQYVSIRMLYGIFISALTQP